MEVSPLLFLSQTYFKNGLQSINTVDINHCSILISELVDMSKHEIQANIRKGNGSNYMVWKSGPTYLDTKILSI